MKFAQPVPAPGRRAAVVLAVAVHLLLIAFLFYGIRWQSRSPEAVEVELVRAEPAPPQAVAPPPKEQVPPAPEVKPEPKPVLKPPPKLEVKPAPKVEVKPPLKPEIAIKKDKPKPVKETPVPVMPKYDPFQKQLDEEIKNTAERKTAADATASAANELARMKAAQAASARDRSKADYVAKIHGKIKGNFNIQFDIKGNPQAIFEVEQLVSGEIYKVTLTKSSGNTAFDEAVDRAIRKSSPLPKPERTDLFEKVLELKFRPLDN